MEGYSLAVDVEATCDDKGTIARHDMEIIEVGAVLIDERLEIAGEFQSFVRPFRNPVLTPFCKALTSITQEDVDRAEGIHEVFRRLGQWLSEFSPLTWYSWGDYDHRQFRTDCERSGAPWPFPGNHINAKLLYANKSGGKKLGLNEAVLDLGLNWQGTHHRGIDDARNVARILQKILD